MYVVSRVPNNDKIYYCHNEKTPNIPVFGSIGDKKKARKICRMMNATKAR